MLVEYSFVTTAPLKQAMPDVVRFVRSLGFTSDQHSATSFVARRGNPKPGVAATLDELPQAIGLSFDRGRVDLVVSMATPSRGQPIHRQRVLLLAEMVEAAMRPDRDLNRVVPRWNLHRSDGAAYREKRVSQRIAVWVALGVASLLLLIVLLLVAVGLGA